MKMIDQVLPIGEVDLQLKSPANVTKVKMLPMTKRPTVAIKGPTAEWKLVRQTQKCIVKFCS